MREVITFFLCFRSELATEVVLHGTIRLDSKIRSEIVHFHDSFWRKQTLAATKLYLSLTRIDFAVAVSSRAVHISSRAVRVLPALSLRRVRPSIRDLFSYGFPRKLRAGPYGSYDNLIYFFSQASERAGFLNPRI